MVQALFPDAACWAQANFGSVDLGLDCRTRRLVGAASRIAERPGASLPALFRRKDLRGLYCLLHRPEASHHALLQGHCELTKQAMNSQKPTLIIHDTTELDFTSHRALHPHLGPIGDGGGRGLLQHNSLAVRAADGLLLGLAHQQLVARQPRPEGETPTQRKHRDRESALWQRGFEGVGRPPQGCLWVDVCDRGADIFEALHASVQLGHQALIRACQDRCVLVEGPDGQRRPAKLLALCRGLPAVCGDVVEVKQKGGRPARQAQVCLASVCVWIEPPQQLPRRKRYQPIRVWVVRVWEPQPPEGVEALEWVLLSTLPSVTEQELRTRRDWYGWRWPVAEDYHQAEKSGCGEEKVRFQDGQSLRAILAVLAAVAVRVVQLRQAARACPDEPAEQVATPLEVALVQEALGLPQAGWTVRQFVRAVAELGGFLGRKCDGEPGWKTLWRGYRKLRGMLEGVRLAQRLRQRGQGGGPSGLSAAGGTDEPP
jgi:hypothetical protein